MAEVILRDVKKIYDGGVVAVEGVNIEIKDREFVVLVGPSGCGKSTTLRMIAGLESISSGDLMIDGKRMNDVPPKDRDIAMVFQNYALYPHMSVYENMAFGLKLRKFPKDEIDRRVKEAAEILGIGPYLDRKPKALSGGQRQRVAVGRAIVRKPKVFLFDEPLSNLDAKLRVQTRTEINKLHRRLEATMVYVTHDQVEAMTMGDRIVVMKDGKVQQIDSPLNLYNQPVNKFVAGFIGSPSMNFLNGKVTRGDGGLNFRQSDGTLSLSLPDAAGARLDGRLDQELTLGIRPEDIYDASRAPQDRPLALGEAMVEVVEPMGNEIFLYLSTSGDTNRIGDSLVARLDARVAPSTGRMMPIALDMSKAHFFDRTTDLIIG